jgi:hypothetical protein
MIKTEILCGIAILIWLALFFAVGFSAWRRNRARYRDDGILRDAARLAKKNRNH